MQDTKRFGGEENMGQRRLVRLHAGKGTGMGKINAVMLGEAKLDQHLFTPKSGSILRLCHAKVG